jgi:TonB family protein
MKTMLAFCIALLGFTGVYSQNTQTAPDPNKVYTVVQQRPDFPGDINAWLAENIVYPQDAKNNNVQGTVYLSFVIEKDGSVSTVKVLRGANSSLDNESVRVVSAMPKWTPGTQDGVPVRVAYLVPIHYTLADNNSSGEKKN